MVVLYYEQNACNLQNQKQEEKVIPDNKSKQITHFRAFRAIIPELFYQEWEFVKVFQGNTGASCYRP